MHHLHNSKKYSKTVLFITVIVSASIHSKINLILQQLAYRRTAINFRIKPSAPRLNLTSTNFCASFRKIRSQKADRSGLARRNRRGLEPDRMQAEISRSNAHFAKREHKISMVRSKLVDNYPWIDYKGRRRTPGIYYGSLAGRLAIGSRLVDKNMFLTGRKNNLEGGWGSHGNCISANWKPA